MRSLFFAVARAFWHGAKSALSAWWSALIGAVAACRVDSYPT